MRLAILALLFAVTGCRNGIVLSFDAAPGAETAHVYVESATGVGIWSHEYSLRAGEHAAILLPRPGHDGMPELPWVLGVEVDRRQFHERCVDSEADLSVVLEPTRYDADGDGFLGRPREACPPVTLDCDDTRSDVFPGAPRSYYECGLRDANCDGVLDVCPDRDGDGWNRCVTPTMGGCDCDDLVASIAPGAPELCENGVDEDCDGRDGRCDHDGDGVAPPADCDDLDPLVFPGAPERCNGLDDTCDGVIDEDAPCRDSDLDGDGYLACAPDETDCDANDCDAAVHPGALDACGDGVDADGDGDDACPALDADGDGFAPLALGGSDCDDADPLIHPLASDRCGDGVAGDCRADRPCSMDVDGDGWIEPGPCEDGLRTPGAPELCNGRDDDCDDQIDEVLSPPSADWPDGDVGCTADPRPLDFASHLDHCGGCGAACDRTRADRCVSGRCGCGSRGACAEGEVCRGGGCVGGGP